MALLFELLLTVAVTLLAAFLLATLFAANDPRREPDRAAAAAIAEEKDERIIEVDEVKLSERRTTVSAAREAEGRWVEAPAVVVKEEEPECSPGAAVTDEEAVPVKAARAVCPGAGLKVVGVGDERCDSTAAASTATGVVVEANPYAYVLVTQAVPREVLDVVGQAQDVGTKQHDQSAEAAPSEVPGVQSEKQTVQVTEVLPTKLEAVEAEQHPLVSEVASAAEVLDAGMEEREQSIQARHDELASETASREIPDVVWEKKEEQILEAKQNESTADVVPQESLDVPLVEKEELNIQQPVEKAIDAYEKVTEVQSREKARCENHPVDQQDELVPEQELVATKTGVAEVSHEGSSSNKVVAELPVEVVTLQGLPEDDAEADMGFGEWERIERSEVEKSFGAAVAFASSEAGAVAFSKLNSDVQLQLQGLLKVVIDGPCYDSTQPLTLRPSSRAKWNEESTGIIESHLTASPNPEKGQRSNIPAE